MGFYITINNIKVYLIYSLYGLWNIVAPMS